MTLSLDHATCGLLSSAAFPMVHVAWRPEKPRTTGMTMVIDKGLGIRATEDLVEVAAPYVDVVKFGWGTSRLIDESVLHRKIEMLREASIDVSLGGTFLEIAFDQGKVREYLDYARNLGVAVMEVSNGIHPTMNGDDKLALIRAARDMGFRVFAEVGRKLPAEDKQLAVADRIAEAQRDLAAGAEKVICEARESGTVGIFETSGEINKELAYQLFQGLDTDGVIWEAPKKSQQVWLLQNLGANINLGNIAVEDATSLETLRLGLRGDTMRDHQKGAFTLYVDVGVGGALRAKARKNIVVVVDALRASTTIIQALAQGARCVRPVVSADECRGDVTAGERGGRKLPNTDFSNSPTELADQCLEGKELVLTATNGTECIKAAGGQDAFVLIGSVTNASAVARAVLDLVRQRGKDVTLLAAGRNNVPVIEDIIATTEIAKRLHSYVLRGILGLHHSRNIEADFLSSESGLNLIQLGYAKDVLHCAQIDLFDVVPVFDGRVITRHVGQAPPDEILTKS